MIVYRDAETRDVTGSVEQGQREWSEPEWIGSLFGGREVRQQGFATESEADGWVRGELGVGVSGLEHAGQVAPTEAGNWSGTVWVDGDPCTRYFPTAAEAWAWVREMEAKS